MPPKRSRPKKPARKTGSGGARPPHQRGKGGPRIDWRLHLVLLLSALLIVALVWLARREERLPPQPLPSPAVSQFDQAAAAREQIEAFLAAAAVPAGAISREPAELPRHYQVRHRSPSAAAVEQLRQRLRQLQPPLVLATPEDGVLTVGDAQGTTVLTIQYLPAMAAPKADLPPPARGGKVAIIVDDLGRGTKPARQLLAIEQPLTFAILPIEAQAAEVARMAHAAGREVMLHVPMEPHGFPVVDPGDDALLVNLPPAELHARLQALLSGVPHVAGVNNHMGSRFTEDEQTMAVVMAVLREQGLYFVDSLTSGHSVGTAAARQAGVPNLRRDVFLDNVAEVAAIGREIRRLAAKAARNGSAVGICHPYPETIAALRQELPALARQGVKFVPVSALLKTGGGGR
jgi:polysaccharide deacetylase 2 family uncharacterized protein YibQ